MIVPELFREGMPEALKVVDPPASEEELGYANKIREEFLEPGQPMPYMVDIVRAFRLATDAGVYVEVGSRDRGNIAWLLHRLADNPRIVDVDIERMPECEVRLAAFLEGKARYSFHHGDSVDPALVAGIREDIGVGGADAVFCDSSHMYEHTLAEFASYWPMVRPGGCMMYHDAYWEGNDTDKGKLQALLSVDRHIPVWCVALDEPVHRLTPRSSKGDTWGGVAVIVKPRGG